MQPFCIRSQSSVVCGGKDIFYYPDLMVTCDSRDTNIYFKEFPKIIIEVLSETTERIDRHEKFQSYTQIETLQEYTLVAQNKIEVTIFRRSQNWKPEILRQPDRELRLDSMNFKTRLDAVYESVSV
jgi:Uma2 family endonuclease